MTFETFSVRSMPFTLPRTTVRTLRVPAKAASVEREIIVLVPEPLAHIPSVNVIVIDDCRQTVRSNCAERGQVRLPLAEPTFVPATMFSATIALSVHSDGMTLLVEPPSSEPPPGPQATTKSENIGNATRKRERMRAL